MSNRDQDVVLAELRALLAEAMGSMRLVSESVGPISKSRVRALLMDAERSFSAACKLVDQL
jgi:hypothetical protein